MRYYIIAGENSGDLHGSNLIKELHNLDHEAVVRGIGGDRMKNAGCTLDQHISSLAFMGFLEVLINYRTIKKAISKCIDDIDAFQPDALILIDYAGFNLRIAKKAKKLGYRIIYYISPKVWAWNTRRALKIKERVDKMFVILPFEVEFYKSYHWDVDFVGNPVKDSIRNHSLNSDHLKNVGKGFDRFVALLPGSRTQEIVKIKNLMNGLIQRNPRIFFLVAGVSSVDIKLYQQFTGDNCLIVYDNTYDVLSVSDAAVVTSGTATLETALFGVPQLVVYKSSSLSMFIAKRVVKVEFISLVNLILDREAVKELIQGEATLESVNSEMKKLLTDIVTRNKILADYREMNDILGDEKASENTAKGIVNYLRS